MSGERMVRETIPSPLAAPGIEFSTQLRHYPREIAVLADNYAKLVENNEPGAGSWGPWCSA